MGKFVPVGFKPRDEDIKWAMKKFNITYEEVDRQIEELQDHEFRRSYTDWNRVFRNWFRSADKYDLLKRERPRYTQPEYTDDQRAADARKALEQMAQYSLKVVK